MKIFLISPPVKRSSSGSYPDGIPRSISRNFGVYPWLGLCYLSSFLKKHNFDSELIDIEAENLTLSSVVTRCQKAKPDIIGISTISFTFLYALKLTSEIKRYLPNVVIVFGGPHVSIYPREVIQHKCIDVGVVGEGEETFLELMRVFKDGKTDDIYETLKNIEGIIFRNKEELVITKTRGFIQNIDNIPFPAIEKLHIDRYFGCNHVKPYITMVTARGCPHSCLYCSKEPWGSSFRFHSAERVVDEIEYYTNYIGIKAIDFYDDTFTVPRSRIDKIINLVKKRNIKFDFGLMTRTDGVDKKLLNGLKSIGCKVIAYGVEFGDVNIQKGVDKELSLETTKKAFRLANEEGIRTVGFFMIGHPYETELEIQRTISLIKDVDADYTKTNILIPYPGSKLYSQLLSTGKLKVDFWSELTKGKKMPIESLISTKVKISRLIKFRNYMNRLPYLRLRKSNLFKVQKLKLFNDLKRTLGIVVGTFFDRKI